MKNGNEWEVNKIEKKLKNGSTSNFRFINNRFIKERPAQEWLNNKYPENGVCLNKHDKENYKKKGRKDITNLDIREWGLTGTLDLSDFENLKELDCSYNLLTDLILSKKAKELHKGISELENDHQKMLEQENQELVVNKKKELDRSGKINLEKLYCSHNQLSNLNNFEYYLLDPKKLTVLSISDNRFSKNDLTDFREFVNLGILHIGGNNSEVINLEDNSEVIALKKEISELEDKINKSEEGWWYRWYKNKLDNKKKKLDEKVGSLKGIEKHCFSGSLKPLRRLTKLEELDISNTDIEKGLEYLPDCCHKLICVPDAKNPKKSDKFAEAFDKYHVSYQSKDYYDLERWKIDAEHLLKESTATEIRKDIKRFFDEWSKDTVKKLKNPRQLEYEGNQLNNIKWTARIASMIGGVLSFTHYPEIGGGIAVGYPFIEAFIIERQENKYAEGKEKWDEFIKDTKKLRNHYRELIDILKPFAFYDYDNRSIKVDKNLENLKNLSERNEFKELLTNKSLVTKEDFADDLRKKEKRREEWRIIGKELVKMSNPELVGKDDKQAINKGKVKEANETDVLIEIVVDSIRKNYGSMGSSK